MGVREILPGLFHWTAVHPRIRIEVSSYWLAGPRVLLDPLLPEGGLDWLREQGPPAHVILTNRHHWRHCTEIGAAFDCPVWCNELGLHEFEGVEGAHRVRGFRAGEALAEVAPEILTHEVGVLCPDETAVQIGRSCLAVADGVVRDAGGPLAFVPDALIADTPEAVARVKRGLCDAYRQLCDLEWDTLLLAHGDPVVGGARTRLRDFCERESHPARS